MLLRFGVPVILVGALALGDGKVCAQNYPVKPVRIVTSESGGTGDFLARLIGPTLSANFGQPVIVDNRGGGIIPGQIVSKAPPDGYTLLIISTTFWTAPLLQRTPYDVLRDFAPITMATNSPNLVVVSRALGVSSVKELIARAKARPGELNYGSGPTGAPNQIAVELFKQMTGADLVRIPYKGSAPAFAALIAGEVQLMITAAASATPHVRSGRLIALAATSAQPSALFPELPTVAATVPGYESGAATGAFAPAHTPPALIGTINRNIVQALNDSDIKARIFNAGADIVADSPEQFAVALKAEINRLGALIRDARIRSD